MFAGLPLLGPARYTGVALSLIHVSNQTCRRASNTKPTWPFLVVAAPTDLHPF